MVLHECGPMAFGSGVSQSGVQWGVSAGTAEPARFTVLLSSKHRGIAV